ncbi:two-component sensor histidine kinase [Mucilaginibacter sp. HMF5004]|uniref:sensor histidine kinase n=1 Tax=Mucilaginibacter rivuli TaxID=2857527 RepID=UPI001C5D5CD0|nr:HAMP domain-containing sensor histidine kinase [Mucilaginibacter rivuli]MBW4890425.1 two-component sensor histidine kinase [Mucilaginibacter rivuli]
MTAATKIRWLLGLICLGLFLTAIIAKQTFSPANNLESSAKTLETNLQQKEELVKELITSKTSIFKLKNIDNDEQYALSLVRLAKNDRIYLSVFESGRLIYWNGIRVLPNSAINIKDGSSFLKESNGYYEVIKKTDGAFCFVFYIPIKNNYSYQNPYLKNVFAPNLLQDNNIEIADFTDHKIYSIHTIDRQYLFSVKLKANEPNHLFQNIQILLWLSGMLLLCVLTHNLAQYFNNKGRVVLSFFIIGGFIVCIRFIGLYYHWPEIYSGIGLFKPYLYNRGWLFPSQGDLVINTILLTWLTVYVHYNRFKIIQQVRGKSASLVICIACALFLVLVSYFLLSIAASQIIDSKINLDVNNVLNLSQFGVIAILTLCFGFFIFVLLAETCIAITLKLNINHTQKLYVLFSAILLATVADVIQKDYSCFYLLWSLIVIIIGYTVYYLKGKYDPLAFIAIIIICACISSVKLYTFESVKEKEVRKHIVHQLEAADDVPAEKLFGEIEGKIVTDAFLPRYFNNASRNHNFLKNRFKKLYYDGYLSKYDFTTYEYDASDAPLSNNNNYVLNDFKSMVLYSATKITNTRYFYKATDSFGIQRYFAIIPISDKNEKTGTMVIDLQAKQAKSTEPFPELLIEGGQNQSSSFKGYSYAYYRDGKLLNQSGKYIYSLVNYEFEGKLKQYIYQTTHENSTDNNGLVYSHLIYQPRERELIVVSREEDKVFTGITSLTFFFLVFVLFTLLVTGTRNAWNILKNVNVLKPLKWGFWYNFDKVLYRTRIQLSMVFAVVVTLIIIGILTFISVRNQYLNQQDDNIRDKITRIATAFEKSGFDRENIVADEETTLAFNSFADTYSADLTFYDVNGKEIITTQPKLYEAGLIAPRMNAMAYIYLHRLQKSGFINPELIGLLNYKAAYAPIRDSKKAITGYLQLPYFSNETEYKEHIGAFLNTMINVYALVFVAIGLFAVAVARQITTPLALIQQSLSKTIYGRKNEPIKWQHNDEIGSLIKEYNNMIAALEDSASKLAQSERENAWREMAKQVAHEIKNPLTPLKLGLQLLEKAWKDKDPKFDQKFERFSKSFVEQIDSLSRIASEFSNFAKMPETQIQRVDIFEIISQAVNIFKQTEDFEILYTPSGTPFYISADKDQILRSFNNLLKNSIEAIPPERKGLVEITYTIKPGEEIYIQVKDNGNGIPEPLRERIFVPNFTTKSSGTGLGLALVKNAITYAGGSISFDTILNEGTIFYLTFPQAGE